MSDECIDGLFSCELIAREVLLTLVGCNLSRCGIFPRLAMSSGVVPDVTLREEDERCGDIVRSRERFVSFALGCNLSRCGDFFLPVESSDVDPDVTFWKVDWPCGDLV